MDVHGWENKGQFPGVYKGSFETKVYRLASTGIMLRKKITQMNREYDVKLRQAIQTKTLLNHELTNG
jgi:hypothetical protein